MTGIRKQTDSDDDGENVIQDLLLIEAIKKTRNVRQVVINELRGLSARINNIADQAVVLAAADLLEK